MACSAAVVITLLCQVALTRIKAGYSGNIDGSDTFKFWKAKFFKTEDTLYPLACGAIIKSISFGDDKVKLEDELIALVETFRGSQPYIGTCTARNVGRWREGFISRQFGLVNSCPATKPEMFGLNKDKLMQMSIDDVLAMIKLPIKVSKAQVIERITKTIDTEEVTLNEPGLSNNATYSVIETEIASTMKQGWYQRVQDTGIGPGPQPSGEFSQEEIKDNLSSLEYAKYRHAISVGNRKVIGQLYDKLRAKLRPSAEEGGVPQDNPEKNPGDQKAVDVDKEVKPRSEKRKTGSDSRT